MPNTIEYAKKYVPLLDQVYALASLTADLESDPELAKEGANANEIVIPKLEMDGLGKYDRNEGYTKGNVKFKYETVKFNYERGRAFNVDNMDEEETMNVIAPKIMGEFTRTKVAPEGDAFTFAKLAGKTGVSSATGALATGEAVVKALRAASTKMDEDQVPTESRILYITPTLKGLIDDLDTTKSKAVLNKFSKVVEVPQARFYTTIDLLDGKTGGEEAGGFRKNTAGKEINFMIVEKSAILKYNKHVVPKIVTPDQNQTADGYIFGYRKYGLVDVYENKLAGVYCHHVA